ncbi:trypsin-like serine peptidase [Candidatus Protochlamydia amoebophila]|uniref:Uncharacterized protein n=1 Tax=Candidatus Protochlamydia amoebophila TaxID=362787 RepID=A0A0C1JUT9_9BACT|nr:serine protease [Candidatus Protochlamydia amoebophila]KIC74151.1 hypothetical protein DB44_AP00050 [Candidatus Protochlamydia amoebophila]
MNTGQLYPQFEMDKIKIVFRFHKTDQNIDKRNFDKNDVYKIKKVINYNYNSLNYETGYTGPKDPDFALIKLDRPVEGIAPLEINFSVEMGREIYALGCPTGTAVKYAGPAFIKEINSDLIRGDTDTFGGNSGGPIIDRTTHKAIAILVNGYKDYVYDEVHRKSTGETRVITFRITTEMFSKNGYKYSGFQQITPEMLDAHRIIAKKGRKIRKEQSNSNSDYFLKCITDSLDESVLIRKVAVGMLFTVIAIPGAVLSIISDTNKIKQIHSELNFYEQLRKRSNYKLNALEAKHENELSSNHLSTKERYQVARNMVAYCITEEEAIILQKIEVQEFGRRFSPDKVYKLLLDINRKKSPLTHLAAKRILKHMQKMDPDNTIVNTRDPDDIIVNTTVFWWNREEKHDLLKNP